MVKILMMSAKMAAPAFLKIKVITSYILSMTSPKKILSDDSNYIMDVVMWPKFGNSSICIKEVIITSIL